MPKLTGKQQAFVEHYCGDANYNGAKACRLAGYSVHTDHEQAARLLTKDSIKQAVAAKKADISKNIEVTVTYIVSKLLLGLQIAEQKQDLVAMARFSELLGRWKAMFTDNLNTTDLVKQKQLTDKETAEARRIASIRLQQAAGQAKPHYSSLISKRRQQDAAEARAG